MNPFSEELRKEREARQLTLSDISQQTRINIKYLQAIEQGAFDVLPQTYVRAFIKAYADAVGMNVVEALKKYDIHSTPEHRNETAETKNEAKIYLRPEVADQELQQEKRVRIVTISVIFAIAVVILGFYLLNYFDTVLPSQTVKENAFQDVVKEQEQLQPHVVTIDSVDTVKTISAATPAPDSLILRVVATDSVWITIIRDSLPPRSGYMLRGRYRTYVARKGFSVSASDGGSIRLLLNGVEIAPIGEKGKRIRNAKITADLLNKP
ncbi:MAG: helix-turn-helix domain-containing protein [Bacteriovoracaceae bacterium]|nr:helix-turn-helix domain-containing protein [Bacteroidota bacterium]